MNGKLYNSETCSDTCDSITSESGDGYVTSTLEITGETDLNVSCVVNQTFTFSSEEPSVEIRQPPTPPPPRTVQGEAAQLTVITAAVTTQPTTTQDPSVGPTEGKKDDP